MDKNANGVCERPNRKFLATGHGPQEGYVGEINDMLSEELGAILASSGVSECEDIPTSGNGSATLDDNGDTYTVTAAFDPGTVTIPVGYDDAGSTMDKRIVLSEEGEEYLLVEVSCEADLKTVYALMPQTADNTRAREVYFQQVPSTGVTRVDVHMTNSNDGEKYVTRFRYANDIAQTWTIRVVGVNASGEATMINTATGVFHGQFHIGIPNTSTDTFTGGGGSTEEVCIDLNTNADAGGDCVAQSLQVVDPASTPSIDGTTYDYVANDIKDLVIGDI